MKCVACGHVNERRKKPSSVEGFETFWKVYPRKVGKFLAEKAWKALKGDADLFQRIMLSLDKQRRSTDWQKDNGAYIPHASTWLHQRRFDDEVPENGLIVRSSANQTPQDAEKERLANERIERLKEREWEKREAARQAQVRDDLRSRKMMEATGEKDDVVVIEQKIVEGPLYHIMKPYIDEIAESERIHESD